MLEDMLMKLRERTSDTDFIEEFLITSRFKMVLLFPPQIMDYFWTQGKPKNS